MVTSTDNWLDSLVKHPIFETDQKQRVDIAEHTNNVEQFILQHHICILTMRDNDLFVAVGSKIRVLNLTEFKEAHNKSSDDDYSALSSVHYKLLDTPEIDFDIQSLTLNLNGRLLSVKGKHSLVVVCLPRQGFGDVLLKREVDCRTLAVGKKYYQKAQLIKVSWHPLSETRTHLVVLDSDSMLRIFDMSTDIEEPEQSFDLSPIENNSETNTDLNRGFSFQEKDVNGYEDAVTFSLGGNSQEQSGWEPFTVYYALRNGHIYSICPVIPFQSVVHQEHLNYLLCLTEAKYKKETSLNNKALASLHRRSLKWLRDLFNSAKISKRNGLAQSVVHSSTLPVKRQGPFLVNYHQDASIHSQVTDILYVASEPIHLLVVALSNGQIQNHILT
ncbi:hypothetical protein G6F56_008317 [Rhizopus delemar]|nr:hypothetical protein G6F56_008317 [Rhizopus delemar]